LSFYDPLHSYNLPSFPTRRSSDLTTNPGCFRASSRQIAVISEIDFFASSLLPRAIESLACRERRSNRSETDASALGRIAPSKAADRKSTRLNSSHDQISYAVFCLK